MSAELGNDTELFALVARIKGFDFDNATVNENLALAQALKIVATDIVSRHEKVVEMQRSLTEKIAVAEVAGELAAVVATLKPQRRGWLNRAR